MKKQNKTTPTTKKDVEEQVSRKLTHEELSFVQGGGLHPPTSQTYKNKWEP